MNRSITRRHILRGAAAAGAVLGFPSIVPSTVFGQTAPSNKLHLAMLGVGSRGSQVMEGFATLKDARFVLLCDPFRSRQAAAAKYLNNMWGKNAVSTTSDYREVMARPDIDAVVICSCDHWHVPLAMAAVNAGKDAYVEKPLGPSLAWHQRLREAVNCGKRVIQYGTQQRSSKNFRYVVQLVRGGYLGRIKHIDAWCIDGTRAKQWMDPITTQPEPVPPGFEYDLWQGPAPERPYNHWRVHRDGFFHNYEYSIGFLGGWGAHPLDIAQWGVNADHTSPVEYQGTGKIPTTGGLYTTVYDWDVHCRYADGTTLHFISHPLSEPVISYRKRKADHGTTFFGENGWISVDRGGIEASDPKLLSIELKPSDPQLPESARHDRNFLDCVRNRQQPVSHLEAAIRSDTISHMSDLCIRLNRTIRWDPKKEVVIDDPQANKLLTRPMRAPYVI